MSDDRTHAVTEYTENGLTACGQPTHTTKVASGGDADCVACLRAALRTELGLLWDDMAQARRAAAAGCWSMGCVGLAGRIQDITRMVGPADWGMVNPAIFNEGEDVFARVHAEIGITVDPGELAEAYAYRRDQKAQARRQAAGEAP